MDRLLAAIGLLDDALPVFAPTRSLPRAGVLLAIPALVARGLLSTAEKIYGSLGPAFYGLRTTLVAYVLLGASEDPSAGDSHSNSVPAAICNPDHSTPTTDGSNGNGKYAKGKRE